ncbi:oligosaccharide flippase family protein [Solitalea sp. MAHUQ-68]|uniref:Oligosaccharide flippase family protein n=1 Tax=Solitalea agri TaxID=2953739 RepID=A0A9X2JBC2_9SPHI|nr:oligosaccharide flippase family protein [Solitalea agri]MCO4291249.1 oligosaccharide flippase family protein [Solitalea agri]
MYLIKKLSKGSQFSKNFLTLLSGTAISQAIPVLISPILTRLYTPENIGVFAIYFSASNVLSILVSGRYELAILLPKEDYQAKLLVWLSTLLTFIICGIFLLLLFLFKEPIAGLFNLSKTSNLIYILPFLTLTTSIFQIVSYWLNRKNDYATMATAKVWQSTGMAFVQITFSFLGDIGLIAGRLIGQIASTIYSLPQLLKRNRWKKLKFDITELKQTAVEYADFPKYSMPNNFINNMSSNLPVFLLTNFFSITSTGLFSWSSRIVQVPMGMITASMQQVFFQEASRIHNEGGNLYSLVVRTYKKLLIMAIGPYIIFGIFAPFIFKIAFGHQWEEAGVYTQYLIPWLFLAFLNSPITSIIPVLNKQKNYLIFEILILVIRFVAIFVGYKFFHSVDISIILYSSAGFLYSIFLFFYLINLAKKPQPVLN